LPDEIEERRVGVGQAGRELATPPFHLHRMFPQPGIGCAGVRDSVD
jgi:hypothetical protein